MTEASTEVNRGEAHSGRSSATPIDDQHVVLAYVDDLVAVLRHALLEIAVAATHMENRFTLFNEGAHNLSESGVSVKPATNQPVDENIVP